MAIPSRNRIDIEQNRIVCFVILVQKCSSQIRKTISIWSAVLFWNGPHSLRLKHQSSSDSRASSLGNQELLMSDLFWARAYYTFPTRFRDVFLFCIVSFVHIRILPSTFSTKRWVKNRFSLNKMQLISIEKWKQMSISIHSKNGYKSKTDRAFPRITLYIFCDRETYPMEKSTVFGCMYIPILTVNRNRYTTPYSKNRNE